MAIKIMFRLDLGSISINEKKKSFGFLILFLPMVNILCVQRKAGYPHNYLQCRGCTINIINFYFMLLFQAKAIALAAKNGKGVCVCVLSYSEYLQIIKTLSNVVSSLYF